MEVDSKCQKAKGSLVNILAMVRIRPLLEVERDEHESIK
jgi:hypothetical protein